MRLRCEILRGPLGDCSNGGISGKHDHVILTDEKDAPAEINGTPTVRLVRRRIAGEYLHIEPIGDAPQGQTIGYMMGGCYVMGSSSMGFPSKYPLPLHDRSETPEQYRMLSN